MNLDGIEIFEIILFIFTLAIRFLNDKPLSSIIADIITLIVWVTIGLLMGYRRGKKL